MQSATPYADETLLPPLWALPLRLLLAGQARCGSHRCSHPVRPQMPKSVLNDAPHAPIADVQARGRGRHLRHPPVPFLGRRR